MSSQNSSLRVRPLCLQPNIKAESHIFAATIPQSHVNKDYKLHCNN